jgi:hypothetical protein
VVRQLDDVGAVGHRSRNDHSPALASCDEEVGERAIERMQSTLDRHVSKDATYDVSRLEKVEALVVDLIERVKLLLQEGAREGKKVDRPRDCRRPRGHVMSCSVM